MKYQLAFFIAFMYTELKIVWHFLNIIKFKQNSNLELLFCINSHGKKNQFPTLKLGI